MGVFLSKKHKNKYAVHFPKKNTSKKKTPEFFAKDVIRICLIGKGHFGDVFKAKLKGTVVALKEIRNDFVVAENELQAVVTLSQEHIVTFVGIVRQCGTASCLIFEYMENGDLRALLKSSSPHTQATSLSSFFLTYDALFRVAQEIGEGMEYLSSVNLVHGDLAAKNCFVSSNGTVKISDFGLRRYICDAPPQYFRAYHPRNGRIQLRWMAPESVQNGHFTLASDIWSYGILLWEIYTWGKLPYFGSSNIEVLDLLQTGIPPGPIPECPPVIREVMADCWKINANERLDFSQICQKLVGENYYVKIDEAGGLLQL